MTNSIDTNDNDRLKITAKSRLMLDMLATACSVSPEDVQKHVHQLIDGRFRIDMHVGSDEQASIQEEKGHEPKLEVSEYFLSRIKGENLAKYAERKPRLFYQIDCWGPDMAGDSQIDPDCTGKGMMGGSTWELMHGTPVRILIADDYTDHELLADMMVAAAEWLRRDPELLTEHHDKQWDGYPDSEIPF